MSLALSLRTALFAGLAAAGLVASAAPALAQASSCRDGETFLTERKALSAQLQKSAGKDKKLDPRVACTVFGKLENNGEKGLKWITANKDWCQIPDQVLENFTTEHKRIQDIKGQACKAAAKVAEAH